MNRRKLVLIVILGIFFAFTASSCKTGKSGNPNSNQQVNNPPPAQVGKWEAQWRSPAAKDVIGPYLSLYSYTCIFAVSTNVVFAAGDVPIGDKRVAIFVRTSDGGQNWAETRIERPDVNITRINALHFINENTGWLAGLTAKQEPIVLKTTDAGTNWEVIKVNFKQLPTAIFFINENNGWLAGTPVVNEEDDTEESEIGPSDLLVTSDGGKTWQPQRRVPVGLTDIHFIDQTTGWIVGQRGAIYKTTDSGRTWDTQKSELEPGEGAAIDLVGEGSKKFNMSGVSFADANNGYAVAVNDDRDEGRVLGTSNSGVSWSKKLMSSEEGYRDVYCLNVNEAWMAPNYNKYIYYTANGGRYWNSEPVISDQQGVTFFKIHGIDANHVWAAAGGGIYHRVVE
jgi:photosystem II stability/assembly factor-like uncharacterized protein